MPTATNTSNLPCSSPDLDGDEIQINRKYSLSDNLTAESGQVFITGTQALVRLPLMQSKLDRESGLNTSGFISGYRGSPLGAYDQQLWKSKKLLDEASIQFLTAVNEELGATAVLGTQQVESDSQRTVDGVFAIWYGKGPGVDRAGDALRHGNAYGSSAHGGVLAVIGDDHGCVSSSMPHQSDITLSAWSIPVLNPSNIEELVEFGLYGWALSRFSGAWVGLKAISETVESGATINIDNIRKRFTSLSTHIPPSSGLHYRWPDLPSLAIEARLAAKLDAVRAFAKANPIDRTICAGENATLGIVTCGKAHLDLLEALRRLQISVQDLHSAGVRIYKIGQSFPIEPEGISTFAKGLLEILVIEEKNAFVEQQIKQLFYNAPSNDRPVIIGKLSSSGEPLLASLGELRPSRILPSLADWLAKHRPFLDRRDKVIDFTPPVVLSNQSDDVKRIPFFCSGCPHNTSTRVPEGSHAQAGIGCHFMASWMPDRETTGLIQMGGEGVDWVSHSRFTKVPHVFQNLGDGTYFHSGFLAIRQAIAAKTNITYKILYNDAVAMTGGQPVDGSVSVDAIARQVEAEGAIRVAVVSDDPTKYEAMTEQFPKETTFHHRDELDRLQRELRQIKGVSVLIYEQTCAAEKRRRRKKGQFPDPDRRLFINASVCEGCGDCTKKSNCLSIVPLETIWGRKRAIDQSSCNKDYSCVNGFCPSFVSVIGGKLKKAIGSSVDSKTIETLTSTLPQPCLKPWEGPYDLLVTGVGGTGVVTLGALITMAAHLEGKSASVLDFMGFAQKGGQVLSYIRLAHSRDDLNQVRIDTQQADAVIACDIVVGASVDALQTMKRGRTQVIANTHEIQTAKFIQNPDADLRIDALLDKIRYAAGEGQIDTCDAQSLAQEYLGDTIASNILLMGFAWQRGLIPVSLQALERAIELNGVAVPLNKAAFAIGRIVAVSPETLSRGIAQNLLNAGASKSLDEFIDQARQKLTAYQNSAYADQYLELVNKVRDFEKSVRDNDDLPLTKAVAKNYVKLMTYKDEYEVARLYSDGEFRKSIENQFEGNYRLTFHMAPPVLAGIFSNDGQPKKIALGALMPFALNILQKIRGIRGTPFDLFGRTTERKMERQLIHDYRLQITQLLRIANRGNLELIQEIASIPEGIRGYGHVKISSVAEAKAKESALLENLGIKHFMSDAVKSAIS